MSQIPLQDISLNELITILYQGKYTIIGLTFLFLLSGLYVAVTTAPVYKTEVLLLPANAEGGGRVSGQLGGLASLAGIQLGSSIDPGSKAIAILKSRKFLNQYINDAQLKPLLFANAWDTKAGQWKRVEPSDWHAYQVFEKNMSMQKDHETGLYKLSVEWVDPQIAADWANELVNRINAYVKAQSVLQAKKSIDFLEGELNAITVVDMKNILYGLMESQLETIMLANVVDEYAFKVIDPAVVPESPIKPNKKIIVLIYAAAGFLISVFILLMWALTRKLIADKKIHESKDAINEISFDSRH